MKLIGKYEEIQLGMSTFLTQMIRLLMKVQLDDSLFAQTTTLVKSFPFQSGNCQHTNTVKIITGQNEKNYPIPQITTSSTKHEENSIKRFTQVKYLNKIYIITDVYRFSFPCRGQGPPPKQERVFLSDNEESYISNHSDLKTENDENRLRNKKLCLFHKKVKGGNTFEKRNTKNVPKNFCKALMNYMQRLPHRGSCEWSLAIQQLKHFIKGSRFNNLLIQKLLSNQKIVPFFKQFLCSHAEEWIQNSKIADKQVHLQAIKIYLQLLEKLAFAESDPSPYEQ